MDSDAQQINQSNSCTLDPAQNLENRIEQNDAPTTSTNSTMDRRGTDPDLYTHNSEHSKISKDKRNLLPCILDVVTIMEDYNATPLRKFLSQMILILSGISNPKENCVTVAISSRTCEITSNQNQQLIDHLHSILI